MKYFLQYLSRGNLSVDKQAILLHKEATLRARAHLLRVGKKSSEVNADDIHQQLCPMLAIQLRNFNVANPAVFNKLMGQCLAWDAQVVDEDLFRCASVQSSLRHSLVVMQEALLVKQKDKLIAVCESYHRHLINAIKRNKKKARAVYIAEEIDAMPVFASVEGDAEPWLLIDIPSVDSEALLLSRKLKAIKELSATLGCVETVAEDLRTFHKKMNDYRPLFETSRDTAGQRFCRVALAILFAIVTVSIGCVLFPRILETKGARVMEKMDKLLPDGQEPAANYGVKPKR